MSEMTPTEENTSSSVILNLGPKHKLCIVVSCPVADNSTPRTLRKVGQADNFSSFLSFSPLI